MRACSFRMDGHDPYGMYYNGLILPNRWGDRPKSWQFIWTILSRRILWRFPANAQSGPSRLPKMYPDHPFIGRSSMAASCFDLALHQQRPSNSAPYRFQTWLNGSLGQCSPIAALQFQPARG